MKNKPTTKKAMAGKHLPTHPKGKPVQIAKEVGTRKVPATHSKGLVKNMFSKPVSKSIVPKKKK